MLTCYVTNYIASSLENIEIEMDWMYLISEEKQDFGFVFCVCCDKVRWADSGVDWTIFVWKL